MHCIKATDIKGHSVGTEVLGRNKYSLTSLLSVVYAAVFFHYLKGFCSKGIWDSALYLASSNAFRRKIIRSVLKNQLRLSGFTCNQYSTVLLEVTLELSKVFPYSWITFCF